MHIYFCQRKLVVPNFALFGEKDENEKWFHGVDVRLLEVLLF